MIKEQEKKIMEENLTKIDNIIREFVDKNLPNEKIEEYPIRVVISFLMSVHLTALNDIAFVCNKYNTDFINKMNGKKIFKVYIDGVNKLVEEIIDLFKTEKMDIETIH